MLLMKGKVEYLTLSQCQAKIFETDSRTVSVSSGPGCPVGFVDHKAGTLTLFELRARGDLDARIGNTWDSVWAKVGLSLR